MSDIRNQPGALSWCELTTPDPKAAAAFYKTTLGWTSEEMPMPTGTYLVVQNAEGTKVGGIMSPPPGMPADVPPHWGIYITVDDVDATIATAEKNGGKVIVPAFDVPEVGRMAHFFDPQGAALAVITYSSEMC